MINYFKYIFYHFLCLTDSLVNFIFSIIGVYPKVDLACEFLVKEALFRVNKEIDGRKDVKEKNLADADFLVSKARKADAEESITPVKGMGRFIDPFETEPTLSSDPRIPKDAAAKEVESLWKPKTGG